MWVRNQKWLLGLLVITGIVRGIALWFFFADFRQDPDGYRQIAENLANRFQYARNIDSTVQPTAFRPPLYPILLSTFVGASSGWESSGRESSGRESSGRESSGGELSDGELSGGTDAPQSPGTWKSLDLKSVALLHWQLSLWIAFVSYLVGRQFGLPKPAAAMVGALVIADPVGIRQSSLVMTETLAVLLATLNVWLVGQRVREIWGAEETTGPAAKKSTGRTGISMVLTGILLGLSALCRPTFLVFGVLVLLSTLTLARLSAKGMGERKAWSMGMAGCGLLLMGMVLVLIPWTARNLVVLGKPVFATTHGGYTVFLGNNDSFYDYLESGRSGVWDAETELREVVNTIRKLSRKTDGSGQIDEIVQDRLFYQRAWDVIRRRPAGFIRASLTRVVRFWSILPNLPGAERSLSEHGTMLTTRTQLIRTGSALFYGLVYLGAVIGVFRLVRLAKGDPAVRANLVCAVVPMVLLVLAFQGLHLVYWSNMRMRAPIAIVLAVLAVHAVTGYRSRSFIDVDLQKKSTEP